MAAPIPVTQLYGGDPALTDNVPTPNSSVGTPKPSWYFGVPVIASAPSVRP